MNKTRTAFFLFLAIICFIVSFTAVLNNNDYKEAKTREILVSQANDAATADYELLNLEHRMKSRLIIYGMFSIVSLPLACYFLLRLFKD